MHELDDLSHRTNAGMKKPVGKRVSLMPKSIDVRKHGVTKPDWLSVPDPDWTPLEDKVEDDAHGDSDSLPDVTEALRRPGLEADEHEYSDPELDALLAEAPLILSNDHETSGNLSRGRSKQLAGVKRMGTNDKDTEQANHQSKKARPLRNDEDLASRSGFRSLRLERENRFSPVRASRRELFLGSSPPPVPCSQDDIRMKTPPRPVLSSTPVTHDNIIQPSEDLTQYNLADFGLDPDFFQLEAEPEVAANDYSDEHCMDVIPDDSPAARQSVHEPTRSLGEISPLMTTTLVPWVADKSRPSIDLEQASAEQNPSTHAPLLSPAPPPTSEQESGTRGKFIAPGFERTGNEDVDDFFDWLFNSGDVKIVDE